MPCSSPVLSFAALVLVASSGCTAATDEQPSPPPALPPGAEALTLFGEPRSAPPLADDDRLAAEAALAALVGDDADTLVLRGRRLSQLGRFREAVATFGELVERFPEDPRGWRYRGHRAITLRDFDRAVVDLEQAARLIAGSPDQDERPLDDGPLLDTLHENVFYHLALAHHLRGDDEAALQAWRSCRATTHNADGVAMASYWMAVALTRLGRGGEVPAAVADVTADAPVQSYHAYHQLALVFRGERDPAAVLAAAEPGSVDEAGLAYGVSVALRAAGDADGSLAALRRAARSPQWHAFGCIAAEAELRRLGETP